jgi:hypothetical protein
MSLWKRLKAFWEETRVPSPREMADYNRRTKPYDITSVPDADIDGDVLGDLDKVALELAMHHPQIVDATGTAPVGSHEYYRRLQLVLAWARQISDPQLLEGIRSGSLAITWNDDVSQPVVYELDRYSRAIRMEELRDAEEALARREAQSVDDRPSEGER